MATGSLFIVLWNITIGRLEGVFVALGQAAAVGENALPGFLGSYFREWRRYFNWIARGSGRRKTRGGTCGRQWLLSIRKNLAVFA